MMNNFDSDMHALKTGVVLGVLVSADIPAYADTDEYGDYTDIIHIRLDMGDPEPVDVSLKVLP